MKKARVFWLLTVFVLSVITIIGSMISASADDLEWNLLADEEAGYHVRCLGAFQMDNDEDGNPYIYLDENRGNDGVLYIDDQDNILGTYQTFTLAGDFYFDAFPSGLRDGKTPAENPLSFLAWIYRSLDTNAHTINSIRIDDEGYIHVSGDGLGGGGLGKTDIKLELQTWYNISVVFSPRNGTGEIWVDGVKRMDFNFNRFESAKVRSASVRYFDGFFSFDVQMKNLRVKTDSDYIVELLREDAADYLGYQTTKAEDGTFTARAVLGVKSRDYQNVGYEAIILGRDSFGEIYADELSLRSNVIYEKIYDASGKEYNIKVDYDYDYAAVLEISDLYADDSYEVVLRPYVLGYDGLRRYGIATTLLYHGEADENGYPVFSASKNASYTVLATDDTFVRNSAGSQNAINGDADIMEVRNPGDANSDWYRAAYVKFTLEPEAVALLESAATAKLRVHVGWAESNPSRRFYDMMVHAVGTDWTEKTLTFANHKENATTLYEVGRGYFEPNSVFEIDILTHLLEQDVNEDGSITVAFRLTNEGHGDAQYVVLNTKEASYTPTIEISGTLYETTLNLAKQSNKGYEPWGYAEALVDEWFGGLYDEVYGVDMYGEPTYYDNGVEMPNGYGATEATGDFTKAIDWNGSKIWSTNAANGYIITASEWRKERFARTLSTLGTSTANAFLSSEYAEHIAEHDVYGGITNAGFTGEATGFFHIESHGDRFYIIDPLGNPYFAMGMNTVGTSGTENQQKYLLDAYGTKENFMNQITKELMDMGINVAYESGNEVLEVENGLSMVVRFNALTEYMRLIGRAPVSEGIYPYNDTINVFDPDFVKRANESAEKTIVKNGYADMPRILGYTTDNELSIGNDMLIRYLTLDPKAEATNAFSYAVAWSWLSAKMDDPNPTLAKYMAAPDRAEMNSEFLGFLYSRYFKVCRDAIRAYDQNHMYLGARSCAIGGTEADEGYIRAQGYYLDAISINLYGGMNPSFQEIKSLYYYGGKPFIVTEFFAKAHDAIDANGFILANSGGAGLVVKTQQDRADYYEHYVLTLLESKACVGWTWYRFRDNDQSIYSSYDHRPYIMLHVTYGAIPQIATFMDEDGKILPKSEVPGYYAIYNGEAIASNQNINKGLYNNDFSSTVSVYTYNKNGTLLKCKSYEVEHPESEAPAAGTVLKASDGSGVYMIGRADTEDGGYTETILTVYKGKYIAFASAIKSISSHIIGIVDYFDER